MEIINHYLRELERTLPWQDREEWVFRGQSEKYNKLVPSVGRDTFSLSDEADIYERFKKALPRFDTSVKNDWELLALAQHHGLPTRLLDWTYNPLTALFFACENEQKYGVDGIVYALKVGSSAPTPIAKDLPAYKKEDAPKELHPNALRYTAKDISSRLVAQEGLFVWFSDPTRDLMEDKGAKWDLRLDLTVRNEDKSRLKKSLDRLGTTYSRLFPDLDGIAKTLAWRMRAS